MFKYKIGLKNGTVLDEILADKYVVDNDFYGADFMMFVKDGENVLFVNFNEFSWMRRTKVRT